MSRDHTTTLEPDSLGDIRDILETVEEMRSRDGYFTMSPRLATRPAGQRDLRVFISALRRFGYTLRVGCDRDGAIVSVQLLEQ